ncbi:DUF3489 domain-containing protein [Sulfuricystis multivorans]|uniref:DUF3489 domain-containing protein n=1 Tax=Sulfuricystis multivorans TaxID=2211108 RepID=UPI0024E008C8|nr:DUF3489 domain-containing protein [Sulfuricystis multivorans]
MTPAAIAIIKGEAQPEDMLPAAATSSHTPPLAATDADSESGKQESAKQLIGLEGNDAYDRAVQCAKEGAAIRKQREGTLNKAMARNSKQAQVIEMLRRPNGATIRQICAVTGWLPHTVRGTLAGALKKKLGLTITSERPEGGERVYRITD